MWREAANRHGAYTSHLWITVLAMLYGTGLRRGELERLNLDAFDRTEGTLRIDGRKTGCERCVPLPEMVLRCLEGYLPLRTTTGRSWIMWRDRPVGEPLWQASHGRAISNGIHAISRRAQVPIHSLHQFRHSCASDLLESGVHLAKCNASWGIPASRPPCVMCTLQIRSAVPR